MSITDLLSDLQRQTGITLNSDTHVANDRIIVLVRSVPLAELMKRIASLHRWEWVKSGDPAKPEYTLTKPEWLIESEKREQEAWRKKQDKLQEARTQLLADIMQSAIDSLDLPPDKQRDALGRDPYLGATLMEEGGQALLGALKSLPPDERRAMAEASQSDVGLVSATNNSHMVRNMSASQPISSFPPGQRVALTSQARKAGYKGDIDNAQVGVFTANGAMSLAFSNGDDAWASEAGLRAPDSPEEYAASKAAVQAFRNGKKAKIPDPHDPDVQAMMRDKYDQYWDVPKFDDLRLTNSTAKKPLSIRILSRRNYIYPFLKAIHDQTGVPIVADGLMHSSRILNASTLINIDKTTIRDTCASLCVNFGRKIVEQDGWLTVSSRRYTIYRLWEPPHERVAAWVAKKKSGGFYFEDYAEMATELGKEQIDTFVNAPLNEEELRTESAYLLRRLPAFRLWNGLDTQKRSKLKSDGILLSDLSLSQKKDFWRLCILAERPGLGETTKEAGVRATWSTQETTMNLRPRADQPDIRTVRLVGMRGH